MQVSRKDFDWAVSQGILQRAQADAFWDALVAKDGSGPKLDLANLAFYFGALIVIGAMGWFMGNAWEMMGGTGLLGVSLAYATLFVVVGRDLWRRPGMRTPGGLLVAAAVSMAPLAIYGLERATGWWPASDPGNYSGFHVWIKGGWFMMEVGTIAAGALALWFFRFPFITAPMAFAAWYMSMDAGPLLVGHDYEMLKVVSLFWGIVMMGVAYLVDRRTKEDFAFWGYLFGLMAFWGALSSMSGGTELSKAGYCAVNLGLMLAAVLLERRTFMVFGSLGVFGYLGHLSSLFADSFLFPFVLSGVGLGIIAVGVLYQKHKMELEAALLRSVPDSMRRHLPSARGAAA